MAPNVLRRLARLPARDRALLVRAVFTLAAARLVIWILPFATGRRLLTRRRRATPAGATRERIRWAVFHAQRVVPQATCLPQALAAESLLLRDGWPAELHIGVKKSAAGKLEAHAWIESDGRVVVGDLPGGLAVFSRLPKLPDVWPGTRSPESP